MKDDYCFDCRKQAFLHGIEASKSIKWEHESEEIERVLKEWEDTLKMKKEN